MDRKFSNWLDTEAAFNDFIYLRKLRARESVKLVIKVGRGPVKLRLLTSFKLVSVLRRVLEIVDRISKIRRGAPGKCSKRQNLEYVAKNNKVSAKIQKICILTRIGLSIK